MRLQIKENESSKCSNKNRVAIFNNFSILKSILENEYEETFVMLNEV